LLRGIMTAEGRVLPRCGNGDLGVASFLVRFEIVVFSHGASVPGRASDGDPEPGSERAPDRLLNRRDVRAGVDHDAAKGLGSRDLEKALAQSRVKVPAHPLESGGAVWAASGAGKANVDRKIQDECEIWLEVSGDQFVERRERLPGQAAAVALVGHGRIGEAVADDPVTAIERGSDGFDEMVAPGGNHEQRLGLGVPALG